MLRLFNQEVTHARLSHPLALRRGLDRHAAINGSLGKLVPAVLIMAEEHVEPKPRKAPKRTSPAKPQVRPRSPGVRFGTDAAQMASYRKVVKRKRTGRGSPR